MQTQFPSIGWNLPPLFSILYDASSVESGINLGNSYKYLYHKWYALWLEAIEVTELCIVCSL